MRGKKQNIVLENPSLEQTKDLVKRGIGKKKTIIIAGNCWVNYEGRAASKLEPGDRIFLLKSDGSALVHRPRDYPPVNWQPPGSIATTKLNEGTLSIRIYRRKENETMEIGFDRIYLLAVMKLDDAGEFYLYASEEDMHEAIMEEPSLLEEGFRPINHEHPIDPGFIDILGIDKNGNLVVVEIKRGKASKQSVHQLKKYMGYIDKDEDRKVRGILVAPDIAAGVQKLLATYNFEYKQLSPQICYEILKNKNKPSLTDFFC